MCRLSLILGICLIGTIAWADETATPAASPAQVEWPEIQPSNVVDEQIFVKLRDQGLVPSALTTDTDFLRRLSLTTIGQLPTPDEVREFMVDQRADKRARKIDALLAHPLHAAMWATRFSELSGNSMDTLEGPDELKAKRAKMWHDWLRKRFDANVPYDKIVRGILTATSRENVELEPWIDQEAALIYSARAAFDAPYADRPSLDLFWRRESGDKPYPVEEMAERVASSFMGVRINCARCHAHPFDRWTQEDYGSFVNIFTQVRFDLSPELRAKLSDRLAERRARAAEGEEVGRPLPQLREIYLSNQPHDLRNPEGTQELPAKPLGGPATIDGKENEAAEPHHHDRRVALMDWLAKSDNPFFARNIVNRIWAHHFGRGMVEPLDNFSASNPPSHPELLDKLASDFIAHGYDIRWLERLILNSTTWQLSSEPNATNAKDNRYFARAAVRMPAPETVVDMWHAATGVAADFGDGVPKGVRAVEIGPSRLGAPLGFGRFDESRWDRFFKLFGRSARTQTCDCEPRPGPSIRQSLALRATPICSTICPRGESRTSSRAS